MPDGKQYTLFIGRWQPFHNGHRYIVDSYVNNGKPVCIAIRDTETTEKNPYTSEQVKRMVEAVYEDNDDVKVIIIPDIAQVAVGRGVGYGIMQVPDEIKGISATKVRGGALSDVPAEVQKIMWEIDNESET